MDNGSGAKERNETEKKTFNDSFHILGLHLLITWSFITRQSMYFTFSIVSEWSTEEKIIRKNILTIQSVVCAIICIAQKRWGFRIATLINTKTEVEETIKQKCQFVSGITKWFQFIAKIHIQIEKFLIF